MKNKLGIAIAILLAAVAVAAVRSYLARTRHELSRPGESVRITVAREELEAGTTIVEPMLAAMLMPRKYLPPRAIPADEHKLVTGQRLRNPCRKGDPILWTDLEDIKCSTFASLVPQGERAATVSVDHTGSVAGLVRPDDHVDVMGTFSLRDQKAEQAELESSSQVTMTILQNVTVLATGTRTSAGSPASVADEGYSSVTLAVTPEEAHLLVFAQASGRLSLILRNPSEPGAPMLPKPVRLEELKNDPASLAAQRNRRISAQASLETAGKEAR